MFYEVDLHISENAKLWNLCPQQFFPSKFLGKPTHGYATNMEIKQINLIFVQKQDLCQFPK